MASDPMAFTALSYSFTVTSDDDELRDHVARVLGAFQVQASAWASRTWPPEQDVEHWRLEAGTADYAVWRGTEQLYRGGEPGDVLDHMLWAVNQRVIRMVRDFYLIHAAVLALPGHGAVLIPGAAGAGKSSLTVALIADGFDYLSDEFAPVDPVTGQVHPYPKAVTLKPGSYGLFPAQLDRSPPPPADARQRHLTPTELGGRLAIDPQEIRRVVFCQYTEDGETGVQTLTPGQLANQLTSVSLGLQLYGARSLRIVERLVRGARGFTMQHRDLDEAVKTVRELCTT